MKNTYADLTLSPRVESTIERQSLLRIIRRFEGDAGMRRREKSPLMELRRVVEWNLMGRPIIEPQAQN